MAKWNILLSILSIPKFHTFSLTLSHKITKHIEDWVFSLHFIFIKLTIHNSTEEKKVYLLPRQHVTWNLIGAALKLHLWTVWGQLCTHNVSKILHVWKSQIRQKQLYHSKGSRMYNKISLTSSPFHKIFLKIS